MKLSSLIHAMGSVQASGMPSENGEQNYDPEIKSIHYRSDAVKPGGIFFAIKGQHADGHHFVGDAVSRGAVAVVVQEKVPAARKTVFITVAETKKALAAASAQFYNNPSQNLTVIGITGTNGKTTTAYLLEHILLSCEINAGVITTINYRYQGRIYDNPLTTPESLDLQRILSEMVASGVTHVVMEVSSHGVALDRIYRCGFDMGIFTNLSQDHLDFHGNMADYWSCKKRFFTDYLGDGPKKEHAIAVINTDDEKGKSLSEALKTIDTITVGADAANTISPDQVKFDLSGIQGEIRFLSGKINFQSSLIGRHNLENIMCAVGASVALKIPLGQIKKGIESFRTVPGRLEHVSNEVDRNVYIDYAHTPEALKKVLATVKDIIAGRLICIFGCGGDRDRNKRAKMGTFAARLSDFLVITSDNPRTEPPDLIIEDILTGIRPLMTVEYHIEELQTGFGHKGFIVEADREKAIALGINLSQPGDTILIAGKGHEDYQIIDTKTIAFSDREKATSALEGIMDKN
jgi:UDP-N-acetylmuramoyl-L-alanyl-D-glutamate--2,6-diaminopimelate ligase